MRVPAARGIRGPAGRAAVSVLVYVAAAIVATWPLAAQLTTHLGAPEGPGDPYLNLWILGWDLQVLTRDPGALLDGRVFDAPIFHPAAGTLAYSDHLLLQAIALIPVHLATGDPVVGYNLLLLASFVLSGLAMHACARTLGAPEPAAYVAGVAWAFWPYRTAHLIHLQLQALYFLPLVMLALARFVAGRRLRDAVLLGAAAGLQAVSAWYYGVLTIVALGVLVPALALGTGRSLRRLLPGLALAALIGTLIAAPFAWPYWRMQAEQGFARSLYDASRHAAVPASYLQVPPAHAIYGRTHLLTARDGEGRLREGRLEGVEQALFPGALVLLLAAAGTVRRGGPAHAAVPGLVVLAAAAFILSLGPDGWRTVYAAAHGAVPGFQAVRAPARFGALVMFAVTLLAAAGAARLARRSRPAAWAAAVLVFAECLAIPIPLAPRPPAGSPVAAWLAQAPGEGAVVYLPLTNDRRNTIAMIDALGHGRPIVNGYSGQRPPYFPALVDALAGFPSPEALWSLRDLGVRFVVADAPVSADGLAGTPLVERARFGGTVVYELVWTAATDAAPTPSAAPPPPPAGPLPFASAERAVYTVRWIGGPLDVPAGTVTLAAERRTDRHLRLTAGAETAPWVASFFEANDRFETEAGAALDPIRHERAIRQGRRQLDRRFVFDHAAGQVRMWTSPAAAPIVLRIPPHTRDALTAYWYVRTLPLDPGTAVTLPVNDGGRTRLLTVGGAMREHITIGERAVPAVRIDLRIAERVPRRDPVRAVVWLSDDDRRVALAADVEAGFGRVRVELQEYTRE
jgi:hypothetical protein